MATKKFTRREFLKFAGIASGAAVLGACAPQVVTQVVKETQLVTVKETQVVAQTQVVQQTVEKVVEVTPTPLPQLVTPQGRVLPPDAAPLEKQIFYHVGAEPKFFDVARDIYSTAGTNAVTEPLLRNNENIELVPAACESWKPGPNAEYWEFVIRKDNVWSDGQPITSDDVVFTYQHIADPTMGNPWVWFYFDIKGIMKVATGKGTNADIGVEKVDDRTFRIYGEYGSIPYLPALESYQASIIIPKHIAEKDPAHWGDKIEGYVSGGPYLVTKWEHNKVIEYEINPKYNGPHKPGIQKMVNPIAVAGASEFTMWQNQEVDLVHILGPAELGAARADPKLNPLLHFFNNFQSTYIAFDTFHPPLDKKEVRLALARAIDRATLCNQVLNGSYVPGYSMLPPGFPAYNPDLKQYQEFNLDEAKKLLSQAGVTDPATIKIDLYSNGVDQFCQFVQQQWQTNLGVKVNLVQVDNATWGQKRANHEMMAYRGPYEYDFVDPSNMLTGLWRSVAAPQGKSEPWGSPRHPWKNDQLDTLLTDAGKEADVAKRIQMYQDAEKIMVSDGAAAFLAHQVVFQIWWPWLVGMHPDKTGNVVYRWLDISGFQMYISKDVDELKAKYK
jgi:ABC-type transport system substrate-binding protein